MTTPTLNKRDQAYFDCFRAGYLGDNPDQKYAPEPEDDMDAKMTKRDAQEGYVDGRAKRRAELREMALAPAEEAKAERAERAVLQDVTPDVPVTPDRGNR